MSLGLLRNFMKLKRGESNMSSRIIERKYAKKNLNTAFFPVEKVPMKYVLSGKEHTVYGYKALVDTEHKRVLSTVTDKYRVVTNNEAYELMKPIAQGFFGGAGLSDFECFNLHIPKSRASCRIDLTRPDPEKFSFVTGRDGDKWTAFIRINNSYNRTSRLVLQIGYCRWICLNGVIFGASSYTLALDHTDKKLSTPDYTKKIVAEALQQVGEVGQAQKAFLDAVNPLHEISMSKDQMGMLFCRVYGLGLTDESVASMSAAKTKRLVDMRTRLESLTGLYADEFSSTAYAGFNVLTDFATYAHNGQQHSVLTDTYQTRVSDWLMGFGKAVKDAGFSIDKYFTDDEVHSYELFKALVPKESEK